MTFMLFMQMLMELSLFASFAGVFIYNFTGSISYLSVFVDSLAFVLAYVVSLKDKRKRFIPLIIMVLPLIIEKMSILSILFQLPLIIYTIYQSHKEAYDLSYQKDSEIFKPYLLSYLGYCFVMIAFEFYHSLKISSLPFACLTLLLEVLLMRSLRHEKSVYQTIKFQIVNIGVLLIVCAISILFSLPSVSKTILKVIYLIYAYTIAPAILILINILMYVGALAIAFFTGRKHEVSFMENLDLDISRDLNLLVEDGESSEVTKYVVIALLIALALFIAFVIFYRLSQRGKKQEEQTYYQNIRFEISEEKEQEGLRGFDPITNIRRQYARFLKHYRLLGHSIDKADTSLEIQKDAQRHLNDNGNLSKLRNIYLSARYDGKGDNKQSSEARKLVNEIKKANKISKQS